MYDSVRVWRVAIRGPADAGGTKLCYCGVANRVPTLRELNRQREAPKEDDLIADKLRYMHAAGELPPQKICVQCSCETTSILQCSVTCESTYTKGRGYWWTVLFAYLYAIPTLGRDFRNPEVHGEDLTVLTPLPVCPQCTGSLSINTAAIRELLCRIPLYAEIFKTYPKAVAQAWKDKR